MFGKPCHPDLALQGGRLVNHRAGTTPLFVHYNGMAKDPGHVAAPLDMPSVYRSLRANRPGEVRAGWHGGTVHAFELSISQAIYSYSKGKSQYMLFPCGLGLTAR
jgi:hypothetical protein